VPQASAACRKRRPLAMGAAGPHDPPATLNQMEAA
jgi:hypothetical protein